MSSSTTKKKQLDPEITGWVFEFLLRQPIPDLLIKNILKTPQIPLSNTNPRIKKTILLRHIGNDVSEGLVSESTLDSIEAVEKLDKKEGVLILESMKKAYCAVAVDCTVRYLGESGVKMGRKGKFFDAVKRVWRDRVGRLSGSGSELVTTELRKLGREMEVVVWDFGSCKKLLESNTRNEALRLVRVYLGEALAVIGPSFLESVARKEKMKNGGFAKDGDLRIEGGADREEDMEVNVGGGAALNDVGDGTPAAVNGSQVLGLNNRPANKRKGMQNNNMVCEQKHLAPVKRPKGPVKITDAEEAVAAIVSSSYGAVTADEMNRAQEALRFSSNELRAVVKDPLPDALKVAGNIITEISEMARKMMNHEPLMQNQKGEDVDVCYASANQAPTSSMGVHNGKDTEVPSAPDNHAAEPLIEKQNERNTDASNSLANHSGEPAVKNQKGRSLDTTGLSGNPANEGSGRIASCIHQNNVPKRSLMEPNGTARTFEWDDSFDGSPEEVADRTSRFRLNSLKRKPVTPLKKYEMTKFLRRRKKKWWSIEEEDALREAVQKFGVGNWKLILNSKRDLFSERTEVDLKDKWRNMTKY